MKSCNSVAPEVLSAWLDGEAKQDRERIGRHVETCNDCMALVDTWSEAAGSLRQLVEDGARHADSLQAVQRIHQRIDAAQERRLAARLRSWWAETWLFHRRLLAGMALATALGALCAPMVVWWTGARQRGYQTDVSLAAAVIESLEVGSDTTAVVFRPQGDSLTTVIWVETADARALPGHE